MIIISIYAYLNATWVKQANYTRPLQGEDKLDETLDSAITDFTLQEADILPPFTKYKLTATVGQATETVYFVVASPTAEKARMGG
ncbi:MAG: hypothetical protein OSJ74_00080 [Clostridia bacterium]|nr:hypothetical protein [Clostridia bacterium]